MFTENATLRAEEELTGLLTTMTDPNWRPVGEEEAATWNPEIRRSKESKGSKLKPKNDSG